MAENGAPNSTTSTQSPGLNTQIPLPNAQIPMQNAQNQPFDYSSPFYLHPSDNPGASLVSQKLVGENNYLSWRRTIKVSLAAKNKLCFIDGNLPRPDAPQQNAIAWDRCNSMVLSWLLNSVVPEVADSICCTENVHEIWLDLEERFSQGNGPRFFELKRSISNHKQENMSISVYYTTLKALWDETAAYTVFSPCTCNASCAAHKDFQNHLQSEKIHQFLMGLSEPFGAIRSQILAMDPVPSISKMYSLIKQDEKQRNLQSIALPTTEGAALAVKSRTPGSQSRSTGKNTEKNNFTCDFCGGKGHERSKCFKLHGFPSWHPKFKQTDPHNPASSTKLQSYSVSSASPANTSSPLHQFTTAQYQQLLSLLGPSAQPSSANFVGPDYEEADWHG